MLDMRLACLAESILVPLLVEGTDSSNTLIPSMGEIAAPLGILANGAMIYLL
jgi:hypothetical protein